MKQIRRALEQGHLILDLHATDLESAIQNSVRAMVAAGLLNEETTQRVAAALLERERDVPTAVGHSTAIPHAYLDEIDRQIVFVVRLERALNLGAPDGISTRFVFFLLGPTGAAATHFDTLAAVTRLMSDLEFRFELGRANVSAEALAAFDRFLARRTAAVPETEPVAKVTPGLAYSGRLGSGLVGDVRRRLPHYAGDFRDGLNSKCVASTLFLFFACLAPAVTFGGVMTIETGDAIGAVEMIVASAVCGVVFALLGGQPLVILGGTGPLLVFTAILYDLSGHFGLPFLPCYAWVGLWSALFLVVLALTDASCLMRYFTRFTDEIFSALITLIFIYKAIESLVEIFANLEKEKHHDTALLSLLLALGTFYIATSLSRFRRSHFLLPRIREFLADFGPAIALGAMTAVAAWLHEVYLDVLPAPDSFGTTSGRPWAVDLLALPWWARFAAAGPALFVTVLVYLDQNITARIVNSPDHRLHKGEAYHLDLAIVGGLVAFCSLFGLPWLVAATVRSLNHVRSLATVEEVVDADGETHDRVVHVQENRVTGLAIHALLGVSLLLLPLLKTIPMAVLYGLFLFMGVVSIAGNQFFERLGLWLRDPALYPMTHYMRRVPRGTIHCFTLLQAACLAILWAVKSSVIGILFPVFIALLVPVRLLAARFFRPEHLAALDAEEEPEEDETHWAA